VKRRKRREEQPVAASFAPGPHRAARLLARPALLVTLAVAVAFGASLANRFTYDDRMVIHEAEPLFRDLPLWETVLSQDYFLASHESTYRPMVTLSYALDYAIGGLHPWVYHLQSVLWHLGCALLVMALARRLLGAGAGRAPLLAGLLFAVHPVLVEAVDNASFREDPIATFFALAAVVLALKGTRRALYGAVAAYLLALFAKESALVVPLLLVGCRLALPDERRPRDEVVREVVGFAAATAVFLVVRFGVMASAPDYGEHPGGSLGAAILGTPRILVRYLRLLVLPWPLCADYSGVFDFPPRAGVLVASLLPLLALAAVVIWQLRRQRLLALGVAWFFVALGPVLNLVAIPVPAAERFLYLPFVGASLCAAVGWRWIEDRLDGRRLVIAGLLAGAALVALAALTNVRHPDWRDNHHLWSATVKHHPRSWGARHGLGVELKERGDLLAAAREMEAALAARPTRSARALITNDLGIAYGMQGRLSESAQMLRESLKDAPHAKTHLNLGITLQRMRDYQGAEAAMREAVKRNPLYGRGFGVLATLKISQGNLVEGAELVEKARRLAPRDPSVLAAAQELERARAGLQPRGAVRPPRPEGPGGGPGAPGADPSADEQLPAGPHPGAPGIPGPPTPMPGGGPAPMPGGGFPAPAGGGLPGAGGGLPGAGGPAGGLPGAPR
jgi:tetratricopeptide (TPR) repeat protein